MSTSDLHCAETQAATEGPRPPVAPERTLVQRLLMQIASTLSRRRAYAATHPMVLAAEAQLLDICREVCVARATISIGVAKTELLIDAAPYETRGSYARELASRLHRRGVGALTIERGLQGDELRAALTWLAREPDGTTDAAPAADHVHITRIAYDHLVLDDVMRDAESAVASLWRTLAELAEFGDAASRGQHAPVTAADGLSAFADQTGANATGYNTAAILGALRTSLHQPGVARRTATALMELASVGASAPSPGRELIGAQLHSMFDRLGSAAIAPILRSLTPPGVQQAFVNEVVDVLPVTAIVDWLQTAAGASEQQLSHQLLRLMTKLSTMAVAGGSEAIDETLRGSAHELVKGWSLADPNPEHHVMLLDRIANFERAAGGNFSTDVASARSIVESARVVQMALELDFGGEDTVAAVEALIAAGEGRQLMQWLTAAGDLPVARWIRQVATSDKAVRQLLLNEPVDRLEARALLDLLDGSSTDTLLDVMGESGARGTRLLVRQRLAEFGAAITPQLLARLDSAHWFLLRNILTLLHDAAAQHTGDGVSHEVILHLLEHPQVQVRVEVLRVLLHADPHTRDAAIRRGLRDESERVVVLALQTLADAGEQGLQLSLPLVTQLTTMVDAGALSEPVRARAVRTLAFAPPAAVRDWLIALITKRSRFLRRLTLTEPTQTAVSALQVLARMCADDPAAAPTLALARRTGADARWQVRDAGSSEERTT